MPIWTIVFNSRNGTQPNGNNAETNYSFDFGTLPDGDYKATFSYMGQENDLSISNTHNYRPALVYMNLGSGTIAQAGNASGTAKWQSSNFLGFLDTNRNTNYAYLYAKNKDNSAVFFNRPSTNQITIRVQDNLGALYVDSSSVVLNSYVLTLSLELVKEHHHKMPEKIRELAEDEYYEEVEVSDDEYELPKIFS